MHEFDLIRQYFASQTQHRADVLLGIGDDAAIVKTPSGHNLAITTDTLVAGVHFPESTQADDIGYKSLAVNLSDLAAMGATPAWVTLAITLPEANKQWIQAFCDAFFKLADQFNVELIGGDLTQGPLSITVQAIGLLPEHQGLTRSGAKPDDLIYVTGTLGDAGLALRCLQSKTPLETTYQQAVLHRLNRPEPRVTIGQHLLNLANSAIDVSDGLVADLSHILDASKVGATIFVDKLPLSGALSRNLSPAEAIETALTAGDDYELCFTVPATKRQALEKTLTALPCRFTCIGTISSTPGLHLCYQDNKPYKGPVRGYEHF